MSVFIVIILINISDDDEDSPVRQEHPDRPRVDSERNAVQILWKNYADPRHCIGKFRARRFRIAA
jgi:hypothetical protein